MKTLNAILFVALTAVSLPAAVSADTTATTTTTTTTFRSDAPIYMGEINDVTVLEPLTLQDFQRLGTKPPAAFEQFQEYKRDLDDRGVDAEPILYKMAIDRTLTRADFEGPGVSPEVAQKRYDDYLASEAIQKDGREVRYVYVYHLPV